MFSLTYTEVSGLLAIAFIALIVGSVVHAFVIDRIANRGMADDGATTSSASELDDDDDADDPAYQMDPFGTSRHDRSNAHGRIHWRDR